MNISWAVLSVFILFQASESRAWDFGFGHGSVAASPTPLPSSTASTTAAPSQIAPPCTPASSGNILRPCSIALIQPSPSPAPLGMIDLLDARVKTDIDGSGQSLYHPKSGKPVCDVAPSPFNQWKSETTTNHHGTSCGQAANITVTSAPSANLDFTTPYGVLENAYAYGYVAQIHAFYWEQVRQEALNYQLNVSPGCDMWATAYVSTLQHLTSSATADSARQDIWRCQSSEFGENHKDSGGMSTSYLCSARDSLEAAFTSIAHCEVHERSRHEIIKQFGSDKDKINLMINKVISLVSPPLTSTCMSSCSSCTITGDCTSCVTSCANQNYPAALVNAFSGLSQSFATPQGSQNGGSP